jgi:hypothetical protein
VEVRVNPLRRFTIWFGVARATFAFKRGRLAARFRREIEIEREVARLRRELWACKVLLAVEQREHELDVKKLSRGGARGIADQLRRN